MLLAVPVLAANAAAVAQARPGRIAVAVFPDLAGERDGQSCPGCDGVFNTDDTDANADEPMPSFSVVLRDADGAEIERQTSNAITDGRHVAFFTVPDRTSYTVVLEDVPEPWAPCPGKSDTFELTADDFNDTTSIAVVEFYMWRGCVAGATATVGAMGEQTTTPADTETAATEAPTEEATKEATKEATTEATTEATIEATTEPTIEATTEPTIAPEPTEVPAATEAATAIPAAFGAIRGVVFDDKNADGRLDPDEFGVAGVEIRLTGGEVERSTRSAGAGTYAFADLVTGSYDVAIAVPDGYTSTTAAEKLAVAVSGDVVMGIDFGLVAAETAAAPTSAPVEVPEPGTMPQTGVQTLPRAGLLLGLAALIGVLGTVGLVLETRRGRRSQFTSKGQL